MSNAPRSIIRTLNRYGISEWPQIYAVSCGNSPTKLMAHELNRTPARLPELLDLAPQLRSAAGPDLRSAERHLRARQTLPAMANGASAIVTPAQPGQPWLASLASTAARPRAATAPTANGHWRPAIADRWPTWDRRWPPKTTATEVGHQRPSRGHRVARDPRAIPVGPGYSNPAR
jgi:hypothetical protein